MVIKRSNSLLASRIGLRELRALVSIVDTGSFRRAAAELGYSQSAVSHQIATLEAALGAPLFLRPGGRGVIRPTPAGRAAYRHARRALGAIEALGADVAVADRGQPARIRMGVHQTAAAELMPAALRAFREHRPGVEVVLTGAGDTRRLIAALAEGHLDLAFAISPEPDDRIVSVAIVEDPFVILTWRDGPLADSTAPSFELLDGVDLVAWTRRWRIQIDLEAALARRGITPRIVYRTDDNLALQRLVLAGLGHAVMGRLAARNCVEPSLTWLAPPDLLVPRQIALCYPRHRELTEAMRLLIEAVRAGGRVGRPEDVATP